MCTDGTKTAFGNRCVRPDLSAIEPEYRNRGGPALRARPILPAPSPRLRKQSKRFRGVKGCPGRGLRPAGSLSRWAPSVRTPAPCLPAAFPVEAEPLSLRARGDPEPRSPAPRVTQPADYWKLKPGNASRPAGCLTTNHLLATLGSSGSSPEPAWLHSHGHGKGETDRFLRSAVSAVSLAGHYPGLAPRGTRDQS